MTRQMARLAARAESKITNAEEKRAARTDAKRAMLERQSAREKAGAYTGRGTVANMASSRSRITTRKVKKGQPFGRILRAITEFGREWSFHATKGWRSHRAA